MKYSKMPFKNLIYPNEFSCDCGKIHKTGVKHLFVEENALNNLPFVLKDLNIKNPFIVCDKNTYKAAGEKVCKLLEKYKLFVFSKDQIEPDAYFVGEALFAFDNNCDGIIGVGSGTINDICKVLAKNLKLPYVIVCTAPSMDGYLSDSSSMIVSGVKKTLYTVGANAVIADLNILSNAPDILVQAGFGDIMAKIISIAEWKISNIITGEYYCKDVADMMDYSVNECKIAINNYEKNSKEYIYALIKGLIFAGLAMSYAKISRPASGIEHYFSHIWDMLKISKGEKPALHGLQTGVGTIVSLKLYKWLLKQDFNKEKAIKSYEKFYYDKWELQVKSIFGKTSNEIIELEKKERKYNKDKHLQRVNNIFDNIDKIKDIINKLPSEELIENLLIKIKAPYKPSMINVSKNEFLMGFIGSKDIRDKYILSRLVWDLGLTDKCEDYIKKIFN